MTGLKSSYVCSSCRRYGAVYLRRSSGERLCRKCLERSLIKSVKKAFRDVNELKPKSTVITLIPLERVVEGTVLLHLLNKVERRYGNNVVAAVSSDKLIHILTTYLAIDESSVVVMGADVGRVGCSVKELFNKYKGIGIELASKIGTKFIVLPFTLNDLNELIIYSLLIENAIDSKMISESFKESDVIFINPFFNVQSIDVHVLAYLSGIYKVLDEFAELNIRCEALDDALGLIKALVNDISIRNTELTYSVIKSIRRMFNK